MAKILQLRRGTTAEISAFTGAIGEPIYNETYKTIVMHDGVTKGGIALAKAHEIPSLVPQATEDVAGKAKIATTAIAQAGTNDTDIITAKKLRAALNAIGEAPMYACRAWVNFNGTGTVSIRNSGNITSITDSGVGRYVANFTKPMPNADYSCSGVCKGDTIASDRAISVSQISTDTNTVSAMPFTTSWAGATQSGSFDSSLVSVQVFC